MTTHNPNNERIKRRYFSFLKEAKRHSEATVDAVAKALARFEEHTKHRDFKAFRPEQAMAFKRVLAGQDSQATGEKLSQATRYATLSHLKRFFQWLACQPGFKSSLTYSEAEYFNLSDKEARVATARRQRDCPTVDQVKHVIATMPSGSEIDLRNRALLAFTLLTGARDAATTSMMLKHVDLAAGNVYQDARDVKTKNSKTFVTYFFPVGDDVRRIVEDWVRYLRHDKHWGSDAPLFPATHTTIGANWQFQAAGVMQKHWSSAAPIRAIFREAFIAAGLPYFNPHSIRRTLVGLAQELCQTPEEFKAWSQNLGHEGVLTTFNSYGAVGTNRQAEILRTIATAPSASRTAGAEAVAREVVRLLRETEAQSNGATPDPLHS
jgi:integrase/recombinase XerD